MTKFRGSNFNHYCLGNPVDPTSSIAMPTYERPVAPMAAPAVCPGQKVKLTDTVRLRIKGCSFDSAALKANVEEEKEEEEWEVKKNKLSKPESSAPESAEKTCDTLKKAKMNLFSEDFFKETGENQELVKDDFYRKLQSFKHDHRKYLRELFMNRNDNVHQDVSEEESVEVYGHHRQHVYFDNGNESDTDSLAQEVVEEVLWKRVVDLEMFEGVEDEDEDEVEIKKVTQPKSEPFEPTVVKPFQMTIREEQRIKDKRTMEEMLKGQSEHVEQQEEVEARIFKAKPVPKHVFQPVFRKMVESQPKRYNVGPITRLKRNASEGDISKTFKAKPFPSEIFTDFAYEKMKEDLAFRNVRKAIRQKELLESAKYPPRMSQTIVTGQRKAVRKNSSTEKYHQPVKAVKVPDFEKLYQEFRQNLEQKKGQRLTTVTEPFSFDHTIQEWKNNKAMMAKGIPIGGKVIKEEEHQKKGRIKKYSSTPDLSAVVTEKVLHMTDNTASRLRRQKNEKRLEEEQNKVKLSERQKLELEYRQLEMRRNNPAWYNIQEKIENDLHEKKTERIRIQAEQEEDYKMDLEKMMMRVQSQPTLFQRQSRLSAEQNAQKVFKGILKKEGLTEEDISKSMEEKKTKRRHRRLSNASRSSQISDGFPRSVRSKYSGIHSETVSLGEGLESLGRERDFYA